MQRRQLALNGEASGDRPWPWPAKDTECGGDEVIQQVLDQPVASAQLLKISGKNAGKGMSEE
jgi:hypothetical protein